MATFTVIYDACVLYPATLRSLMMYLAMEDLFRARWSSDIHAEWMRNVLKDHPHITQAQVARIRDLMDRHVPDGLVTGYEPLIAALGLPDPNDRHVLAAAIRAGAGTIVTTNLRNFPSDALKPFGIEAQHPDDFIAHLLDLFPMAVCRAFRNDRERLKNPPMAVDQWIVGVEKVPLPKTVERLRCLTDSL